MSNEAAKAMKTLKQAMHDDPEYAHSWHCNIAMMCADAIQAEIERVDASNFDHPVYPSPHIAGNDAASRFMKLCFDVETQADPQ